MEEFWKTIPSHPEYAASSLGRIMKKNNGRRLKAGSIISNCRSPSGYFFVCLWIEGKQYHRRVNRLVCEAFHGSPPTKSHESAHLNGDKEDNRPENLKWATKLENESHKIAHGTRAMGEKQGMSKLTAEDVIRIRASEMSGVSLAKIYGVSQSQISAVRTRRDWRHI